MKPGLMWESSQPTTHEINATTERANSDVLSGNRATLVKAGHPAGFESFAPSWYAMRENTTKDIEESPHEMHHGAKFPWSAIPYRYGVFFKPAPTKFSISKLVLKREQKLQRCEEDKELGGERTREEALCHQHRHEDGRRSECG